MASSSSSSLLAPAFSSQSWKYDVFLSFRGEDTRKNFVDHLYKALLQQGIDTYKDDKTLLRGESINPSLMKAIQESQISVVVFSKNYADSSWCLDELVHIMKCKATKGQIVMPIFYDVEPTEVRKQMGKYGTSFFKHWLVNWNKVESWRKALVEASNLSGWEPKNIANGHESKVIEEIVGNILSRLQQVTSSANENLIGIAARVQRLRADLQIGSDGVRMIGIWGVGGGGKTTLASCVYDEICSKFEGCCFLENVREESSRHGLGKLKDDILSKMEANNTGGGRRLIDKRFRTRKVLIVLDDVDRLEQLKALAGSPDWFGNGSRIIITTRDEHLLNAHKVVVHDISLLNSDEAIELFRKHAPWDYKHMKGGRMEDYKQLSEKVVSYAGGLPLALTVLGSFLCDKNIEQWRSTLSRLKEIPDADITEKLKISFDGLTKVQKELFLDIACFYRRGEKDTAIERLDACGFHPVIGVEELRQKALITFTDDGDFDMHDLVQEMGHFIVRGEHPNNPAKHTRVWKNEDILKICAMDASTELDKIEAIEYSEDMLLAQNLSSLAENINLSSIVANMKNIRYISWIGRNQFLDNFQPMALCCLVLWDGLQKQLWNGYKSLPNLKIMDLWHLKNLIMTPNFDGLSNLERFRLQSCSNLEEIDASFGRLEGIVSLCIVFCAGIKKFPSITRLKKLQTLSFKGSPGLFDAHNLNHIRLPNLRKLDLSWCALGDEYMSSAVWELPNLQQLNLERNNFSRLDFNLLRLPRLKRLNVSKCQDLVKLSELPSSITVLKADFCRSLETLGDISNYKWLWKVSLDEVDKIAPPVGDMLLDSMLKRNAFEDDHLSITLHHNQMISTTFVDRMFGGREFTLRLPDDWYNEFCGFLIHLVTYNKYPEIDIIMKQEVDEDHIYELSQEYSEAEEPEFDRRIRYVGYISFSSLRRSACFNSTYNAISFSLRSSESKAWDRLGVALIPMRRKDDHAQTTQVTADSSEFWDGESDYGQTFKIHQDSNSSTNILWRPQRWLSNDI